MPKYDYLRLKTGQVITQDWFNDIADAIEEIDRAVFAYSAVDYYGYVHKDLIPDTDLLLNLGMETRRFKQVHAGYGYFVYGIFPRTTLLGLQQDYLAHEFTNIFDPDLVIEFNGLCRVKAKHEYDFYAYLYWIPYVTEIGQLAALNEGKVIPKQVWKEMDFTVSKADKVNVQVTPSGKVTIAVYNIP